MVSKSECTTLTPIVQAATNLRFNTQTFTMLLKIWISLVSQTHSSSESEIQKQGYHHFAVVRKKAALARSHSGGIAVLIWNHLAAHTTMCDWSNPSCLAIRIQWSVLNYEKDLYVIMVYIPPEGSTYLKANAIQPFDLLKSSYAKIPPDAHVVLLGDFNAHINSQSGDNPTTHPSVLPEIGLTSSYNQPARLSLDKRPVYSNGRQLLQFCNDRNLSILNRCAPWDTQGYFTYEKGLCRSVIDYGLVSQSMWPCVRSFQVGVHNSILSDHSIILLEPNSLGLLPIPMNPPNRPSCGSTGTRNQWLVLGTSYQILILSSKSKL